MSSLGRDSRSRRFLYRGVQFARRTLDDLFRDQGVGGSNPLSPTNLQFLPAFESPEIARPYVLEVAATSPEDARYPPL